MKKGRFSDGWRLAGVRTDVAFTVQQFGMTERRACKLVNLIAAAIAMNQRRTVHLARQKPPLRIPSTKCAAHKAGTPQQSAALVPPLQKRGFGGWPTKEETAYSTSSTAAYLHRANQERALDFAAHALATGRGVRVLAVVDAFTRDCLILEVATVFRANA